MLFYLIDRTRSTTRKTTIATTIFALAMTTITAPITSTSTTAGTTTHLKYFINENAYRSAKCSTSNPMWKYRERNTLSSRNFQLTLLKTFCVRDQKLLIYAPKNMFC